jgi:cellulose synthase/poly-beta-1,6-N-acetylglucosamine synthase-like glycosyltransferase
LDLIWAAGRVLIAYQWVVIVYFLVLTNIYMVLVLIGFFEMVRYRAARREREDVDALVACALTPPVSVLAPAYNEAATICESVRALLSLSYAEFEVIVINDGSTDSTLSLLIREFHLYRSARYIDEKLTTKPVRGVYQSMDPIPLVVIDKENGGKADALNAGINAARNPLVCSIDSDSLLEQNALMRVVRPLLDDPDRVLAVGGIVRIANGCTTSAGRVVKIGLPNSWIARFQVVEYLRAFLGGRVAFSSLNSLLIVSGAFGLFNKAAVLAVGGYDTGTVGEDMELIVRLHRWAREQKKTYRIVFEPDPVCWTEAPESFKILKTQRNRWQRGTVETLCKHRDLILRPGFGMLSYFALPYFIIFEALGPIIECTGYLTTIVGLLFGLLDAHVSILFFVVAVLNGIVLSASCVVLEELSSRRYPDVRSLAALLMTAVMENLGFRQIVTFWRAQAIIDLLRGVKSWGVMERRGFGTPVSSQRTTEHLRDCA